MNASVDLIRHEVAHALGGLVSGSSLATIKDDGISWVTHHEWAVEQPSELATMTAYLCGPLCYPDSASSTDKFLLHIIRKTQPALFEEIRVIAQTVVKPAVDAIDMTQLDEWISKIEAGGTVYLKAAGRQ